MWFVIRAKVNGVDTHMNLTGQGLYRFFTGTYMVSVRRGEVPEGRAITAHEATRFDKASVMRHFDTLCERPDLFPPMTEVSIVKVD